MKIILDLQMFLKILLHILLFILHFISWIGIIVTMRQKSAWLYKPRIRQYLPQRAFIVKITQIQFKQLTHSWKDSVWNYAGLFFDFRCMRRSLLVRLHLFMLSSSCYQLPQYVLIRRWKASVQVPALPQTSCMTLGKSLSFPFSVCHP